MTPHAATATFNAYEKELAWRISKPARRVYLYINLVPIVVVVTVVAIVAMSVGPVV
jgi:hypothetical protein